MELNLTKILDSDLFFWFVWALLMTFIFWILNKFVKTKDKITEKEMRIIRGEKFPEIYNFYRISLTIGVTCILILLGLFLFWRLTKILIFNKLQSNIFFNYSIVSGFLWAMIFMFFGIYLADFLLNFFAKRKYKFGGYLMKHNLEAEFSIKKKINFAYEYNLDLKIILISFIVLFPILILSLDNYSYFTEEGLIYNGFFSLKQEKEYKWEDIVLVEPYPVLYRDISLIYLLHFNDGKKLEIGRVTKLNNLQKINTILHSKNITFSYSEIEPKVSDYIKNEYSKNYPERLSIIQEIFKI